MAGRGLPPHPAAPMPAPSCPSICSRKQQGDEYELEDEDEDEPAAGGAAAADDDDDEVYADGLDDEPGGCFYQLFIKAPGGRVCHGCAGA